MMMAIKYAREQKIPFLGICLGFQLAVIEWARNVLQIAGEDGSAGERLFVALIVVTRRYVIRI